MLWPLLASGGLGIVLGARHAFEPDHLAAVSTLVADRPRPRQAALLGALWGLGHTIALLAVGVVLLVARAELSPTVEHGFEVAVAAMLIGLGARSLVLALRDGRRGALQVHAHGDASHVHAGPRGHVHVLDRTLALRPLIIGTIHGLAGSGAMAALAMAQMPTRAAAVAYVLLFGLGSSLGMAAVSSLAAVSLARVTARGPALRRLRIGAGALAVVVGIGWGALALTA